MSDLLTAARRNLPRPYRALGALAVTLALAACGSTPRDETATMPVDKLYEQAREDAAAGAYDRAARAYERLEGRAAGTLLAQQAQLELAHVHYKTGERAQALATLDRFLKLHPTSPAVDYALYLKGLVNFNDNIGLFGRLANQNLSERDQQASRDAYESFSQLVDRFPESRYADDSRQRMVYIINSLAEYELHVARYYYKRGAYVAAANRAQRAVKDYEFTPAVEEALSVMALSYDRLGLTELRNDAARVLKTNFPQSEFLAELPTELR